MHSEIRSDKRMLCKVDDSGGNAMMAHQRENLERTQVIIKPGAETQDAFPERAVHLEFTAAPLVRLHWRGVREEVSRETREDGPRCAALAAKDEARAVGGLRKPLVPRKPLLACVLRPIFEFGPARNRVCVYFVVSLTSLELYPRGT